jgi:hypothetical protein
MDQDHGGLVGRRGALCSLICSAVCARSVLSALSLSLSLSLVAQVLRGGHEKDMVLLG